MKTVTHFIRTICLHYKKVVFHERFNWTHFLSLRGVRSIFQEQRLSRPTVSLTAGSMNLLCSQLLKNFCRNIHSWRPIRPGFPPSRHSPARNVALLISGSQQSSCHSKHTVIPEKGTHQRDCMCAGRVPDEDVHSCVNAN